MNKKWLAQLFSTFYFQASFSFLSSVLISKLTSSGLISIYETLVTLTFSRMLYCWMLCKYWFLVSLYFLWIVKYVFGVCVLSVWWKSPTKFSRNVMWLVVISNIIWSWLGVSSMFSYYINGNIGHNPWKHLQRQNPNMIWNDSTIMVIF